MNPFHESASDADFTQGNYPQVIAMWRQTRAYQWREREGNKQHVWVPLGILHLHLNIEDSILNKNQEVRGYLFIHQIFNLAAVVTETSK